MRKLVLNKKFNIKTQELYQKLNFLAVLICLFFVGTLSIGYAYLQKSLDIKGDVTLRAIKDIRVMSIGNFQSTNGGYDIYNPKYTTNTINTKIDLPSLTATVTYTATIVNNGTVAMDVSSIVNTSMTNENMIYELNGLVLNQTIAVGQTATFTITYKYKSTLVELPTDTTLGNIITFGFIEHQEAEYDYIKDGIILNLKGTDAPINNIWYDNVSNQEMYLKNNVVYNSESKSYQFSQDSYATLEKPIIPEYGDFTLEVLFSYPNDIETNLDQAIVAQVSDTSNDTGRFKLNAKLENYAKKILLFYNDKMANTNQFLYLNSNAIIDNTYLVQIIRSGEEYQLYLNGVDTNNGKSFSSQSPISQGPFKIGKWNQASLQPYHGNINTVRVYNRALTNKELFNNKIMDDYIYYGKEKPEDFSNLYDYATHSQISTNNGDVYIDNVGHYVYRGNDPKNYLKFNGSDDLYRIISYDTSRAMKVINVTDRFNLPFDESGNRHIDTSSYCDMSSTLAPDMENVFYGCNAWNKDNTFFNGTVEGSVETDSTSLTFLNQDYYNNYLETSVKSKILNYSFPVGIGKTNESRDASNTRAYERLWQGNIGLLNVADTLNASTTSHYINSGNTTVNNYLIKIAGEYEAYWTLSASEQNTYDVYAISRGYYIGKRRSSRYTQTDSGKVYTYYIAPVFYVSSDIPFLGSGSKEDPFIIN